MTMLEIVEKVSEVGWCLVQGAELGATHPFLAHFPLDASASRGELAAALAASRREVVDLKSTVERQEEAFYV
jgi:hypothetical protein